MAQVPPPKRAYDDSFGPGDYGWGSETTVTLNPPEVITYTVYPTTTILDTSTVVLEQTTHEVDRNGRRRNLDSNKHVRFGRSNGLAIHIIGITLVWNLWGIRWLFYSVKSFTAFVHESGHVVGLLVSSQPLHRFTIDPNLGGATYTTPGRRLKAPAMYLGQVFSIAFGGAMVFAGFNTLASKYASFVVMALWLPVIGLQRNLLSMLNCAVPLGLLIGVWFIDHARDLRFYILFIGILSSFYIVWDTMDDFFHRKQNECCVVMLESNTARPAAVWFIAWLVMSLVILAGCILGAIALFRQTEYGMYCEGQSFAPT
ncbi:hypothetical protein Rhopal_001281-T1 [Rhodotorula paludigena]|uniref:Peptidase M50B-like-domain-containing protein n=1 Tax=Rhodotorula paludigena TaxID=86838 RepID=A0AAV5GFA6_9BASI|nr:hypothetical protein Rhopal_001281-T1 [Rhodotorula paludigena]